MSAARRSMRVCLACLSTHLTAQHGLSGPSTAAAGSSIVVRVATNDASVQVRDGGPSTTSVPVPPSKRVEIPVPVVAPGTVLRIRVGKGLRAQVLYVEVL